MATKTVAAGGGNFNVGATWVGGVAPVAGDDIVANATSGNLTLTATTVSLLGANFTGYTGTLALGAFNMLFQTAASTGITLATGMTITWTTGKFDIRQTMTLTSAGKTVPLNFQTSSLVTLTLSGNCTSSLLTVASTVNMTITGADFIYTGTAPADVFWQFINIASGYVFYYRPTGTLTLPAGATTKTGKYSFDTTQTISISTPIRINSAITLEFLQSTTWSGTPTSGGFPNLNVENSGSTIINTGGQTFNKVIFLNSVAASTMAVTLTSQLKSSDIIGFINNATTETANLIAIRGTGGFTCSTVYIGNALNSTSSLGLIYNSIEVNLIPAANYWCGDLIISSASPTNGGSPSSLRSATASTPVNLTVTSRGNVAYSDIRDINNFGVPVLAVTDNTIAGNVVGFITQLGSSTTFIS